MKRFVLSFLFCLFLIIAQALYATTGTVTIASTNNLDEYGLSKIITITGVGDVSAGTFPTLSIDTTKATGINVQGKKIREVKIIPESGTTPPNALTVKLYDATDYAANTTNAFDILGGQGVAVSVSATTKLIPTSPIIVSDKLVLALTGNTTDSATVTIYIVFGS